MLTKTMLAFFSLLAPSLALATTVQFQTSMGDFEVALFDQGTPKTVANFLSYVQKESYENNIIHRSVSGFVIQGGGFTLNEVDNTFTLSSVTNLGPVINEPVYSNLRGTIAMAKLSGNPNSATNQWFINLQNNSNKLDTSNGGYTVFGQVLNNGMDIVDAIAALKTQSLAANSAFEETPLRDYTCNTATCPTPTDEQFVVIYNIVVVDASTNSSSHLNPKPNEAIKAPAPVAYQQKSSGGGSATQGFWLFILLALFTKIFTAQKQRVTITKIKQ